MRQTNKTRRTPYVKPVKRIELTGRHFKLRAVMAVLLFLIGLTAIFIGLRSALNTKPGWKDITVTSDSLHYGEDFLFSYDFTDAGREATAQEKQINSLYSAAMSHAYRVFNPDVATDGVPGVAELNARVNEIIRVDEVLYTALSQVKAADSRLLYLAPVYAAYDGIYLADSDAAAVAYDPNEDEAMAEEIAALVRFVSDPEMVDLELLEDSQVCLHVADEYLRFAQEHEITTFLDFHWMRNAFVIDYAASLLAENGFTSGYLASYDGFTRNLDGRALSYSVNQFDREGTEILMPAVFRYQGPMSIVSFRDYPMSEQDRWHYYVYEDGRIAAMYTDPADGMQKAAVSDLTVYAGDESCAELLLRAAPVFIADTLQEEALLSLLSEGVAAVWCRDGSVRYTDAALEIALTEQGSGLYTLECVE
ncbi:MAG: hypothetical protein E7458_10070 [Ruminococcaceae bacterium]|nr:hypothetical protein [Oscillospiraceae bacterium]